MVLFDVPIQVKASLAVLSAQFCFSGWHIVGSVAFKGGTNPFVFILYRLLIGTSLMHLYIRVNKLSITIEKVDYNRMYLCGFLSFFQIISGSLALSVIAPSRFAIFQPCIPCVVTAISMIFRLEQISPVKLCGIALAVVGAFVAELWKVNGQENHADETNIPLGVFLSIMQVVGMASLMVVVKPLLGKYDPAVVSGMYFVVSTIAIVIVVICRIDLISFDEFIFEGKLLPWLAIWYVAIFATMYSFSAINWGGKHLPPTVTTVFFTFQPVGTIILSATLLGAVVTIPEILGGLLIVLGLVVTSFAQSTVGKNEAIQTEDGTNVSKLALETEDTLELTHSPVTCSPLHSKDSPLTVSTGLSSFSSDASNVSNSSKKNNGEFGVSAKYERIIYDADIDV